MNRATFLAAVVLLTFGAAGARAEDQKITITGSSTVAPLVLEIAKRFEKQNKGVRIDVQTGGSGRGLSDARSGLANIGMASRALKPEEKDLKAFTIASDGICVIIHKANPVSALTNEQVKAIYTGQVRNWKEVGGKDAPITVVNKAEGRSTLELFLSFYSLKNSDIKAQVIIGDNAQGIKTVSGNSNSIGYVSIGTAESEAGAGTPIKPLGMDGIAPSMTSVANGKFPLSRSLILVTKDAPQGVVKRFIDFAQSQEVHDLVKEQFFVPLAR